MSTSLWRRRRVPAAVVAVLGLSLAAAAPAFADTGTWLNGGTSGATVSVAVAVIQGDSIHLEGTGWTDGTDDGDADGSWIAVKLGAACGVEGANLTTEPASGQFIFPGQTSGTASVWSGVVAGDDGDFSVDIPFPTTTNTANPVLASDWSAGTTHHLQLLTGSVKPGGDAVRSVYVTFTVSSDTIAVSTSVGTRGATAGQLTVTTTAAAGSSVTGVSFDGTSVTTTGLPAAVTDGVATVGYSIPADQTLGAYPVTVTLANPDATFTLTSQKISPDATTFGVEDFTLLSDDEDIFQGLYQSAFSTAQNALYATAAAGTGTAEDGYLYKLDPDTLEILASVHPQDVTDVDGVAGQAPYGVGVDDVNGTVWVTNTRTGAVAVCDADDLTLLKQYPAGTISHPRDVV